MRTGGQAGTPEVVLEALADLKNHLVRRDSSKFGRSFYLDLCDTPERDANTKSDERSDLVCHPRSFVFIVRSAVLSAF